MSLFHWNVFSRDFFFVLIIYWFICLYLYFITLKNIVFKKCGGGGQSVNGKGRGYESDSRYLGVH